MQVLTEFACYEPGQTVRGIVYIRITEKVKFDSIWLEVKGIEFASMRRSKAKEKDEKKHFPRGFSKKFKDDQGDNMKMDMNESVRETE